MSQDIAIAAKNLSKVYRMWDRPSSRLVTPSLEAAGSLFPSVSPPARWFQERARHHYQDFVALKDISFELRRGEALGIIGRNGSGKSTLLQILAGTLQPSDGKVNVNGRIAALLELGSGFNPDFTGRENVYLNAAVLGLSREETDARFEQIAAFADIGDFIEHPVSTYSSGMMIRLAFAVSISIEPDILIVDEALSVGDVFFQQKCFQRIHQILESGTTLLFVSHDIGAVQNLCSRAILLRNGHITHEGSPETCWSRYFSLGSDRRASFQNHERTAVETGLTDELKAPTLDHNILDTATGRHGTKRMEFTAIALLNEQNLPCTSFGLGETIRVCALLRANEKIEYAGTGVRLHDRMGNLVFAAGNRQLGIHFPPMEPGCEILICFQLSLSVNPAEYSLTVDCSEPTDEGPNHGEFQDVVEGLGPIGVHFDAQEMWPFYGMAQLPLKVSFETVPVDTRHNASPPDSADDLKTEKNPSRTGDTPRRGHASD
ncbi:MAG: ABC transporter ATP-binding protein [Verrucomicrobia bacterium]|nr:MAG: ABC transporter ATP-binding protein [Verrucomicrobiota bacterium]